MVLFIITISYQCVSVNLRYLSRCFVLSHLSVRLFTSQSFNSIEFLLFHANFFFFLFNLRSAFFCNTEKTRNERNIFFSDEWKNAITCDATNVCAIYGDVCFCMVHWFIVNNFKVTVIYVRVSIFKQQQQKNARKT